WSVSMNSISLALAETGWTVDRKFEHDVIVLKTSFNVIPGGSTGERDEDNFLSQYYAVSIDTDIQFSDEGSEYYYLHVRPISFEKVRELEQGGGFHLIEKGLDYGVVELNRDRPLGVRNYSE